MHATSIGSCLIIGPGYVCTRLLHLIIGRMEKQKMEMEMKWKLETEMERQPLSCWDLARFVCCWLLTIGLPEISAPPVFLFRQMLGCQWFRSEPIVLLVYWNGAWVWRHHLLHVPQAIKTGSEEKPRNEAAKVRMCRCFKTRWNYSHSQITITLVPRPTHMWTRLD